MMAAVAMFAAFTPMASAGEPESPAPPQNVVGVPSSAEPELNSDSQLPSGTAEQPKVEDPGTEEPTVPTGPVTPAGSDIAVETEVTNGYSYKSGVLTISADGDYTLSMASNEAGKVGTTRIVVTEAYKLGTITLNGLNLQVRDNGIDIDEHAKVTLRLVGNNAITTSSDSAIHFTGPAANFVITADRSDAEGSFEGWAGALHATTTSWLNAAIGGNQSEPGGVTINGGKIVATADSSAAAIGGGQHGKGTEIVINDGNVTATFADDGGGTSIGDYGSSGDTAITIAGGVVNAPHGITGGKNGNKAAITISGGVVAAVNDGNPAIGGAANNTIVISGGTVTATASGGSFNTTAIGGGHNQSANVTITGGTVTASANGTSPVGIGSGANGTGIVSIEDDANVVVSITGNDGVGIGGDDGGSSDVATVTIKGTSTVTVTGTGKGLTGIGGSGTNGNGNVTIESGTVDVKLISDGGSTGIGGSGTNGNGTVTIKDGTVTIQVDGDGSTGIGGVDDSKVTVASGAVTVTVNGDASMGIGGADDAVVDISAGSVKSTVSGTDSVAIGSMGTFANGSVTISGGVVDATAMKEGSIGIGGPTGALVTITGGVVEASGGEYGIGYTKPWSTSDPHFSTTGTDGNTGNAVIKSNTPIKDQTGRDNWSGVIFEGKDGIVHGKPAPPSFTIEEDETLTIPDGSELILGEGTTLTNNGSIKVEGNGNVSGEGTIGGTTGSKAEVEPTKDNLPDLSKLDLTYADGTDHMDKVKAAAIVSKNSVAGGLIHKFPSDWEVSVWKDDKLVTEVKDAGEYEVRLTKGKTTLVNPAKVKVKKAASTITEKLAAPVVDKDKSVKTTVVLTTEAKNVEYQARKASDKDWPDKWQDSPTFSNLAAKTEYQFRLRDKGDKNHEPSQPSDAVTYTTGEAPAPTPGGGGSGGGGAVTPSKGLEISSKPAKSEYAYGDKLDLTGLVVTDASGKKLDAAEYTVSGYRSDKPGVQKVTVALKEDPKQTASFEVLVMFKDVNETTPHHEEIKTILEHGITRGFDDGTFRGMSTLNRQDLAAFLYRLAGQPDYEPTEADFVFADVTTATPHYREILWAAKRGVIRGFEAADGTRTFAGGRDILRQDMVAMLWRLAGSPVAKDGASFADVTETTPHREAIAWAKSAGVTTGFPDGTFKGGSTIVRQDTAAFLGRMIDKNLVKL